MPEKPPAFSGDPYANAPHRKLPKMPGATELAAMIRDGWSLAELAERYGRSSTSGIRQALSTAGWSTDTGEALTFMSQTPLDSAERNSRPYEFPEWMLDANCAGTDPEIFFPEKGGSTREAKSICARCTVSAECLDYGLEINDRFGIFGGLAPRKRRALQHQLDQAIHNQHDQESA